MSEIKVNSVVNSTGDNDSGLDLSTNDQVIIKTANTTAVTVDSSQDTTVAGNIKKTGDLTLDVSGDIILDADDAVWKFQDGGTEIFQINSGSQNANLKSTVQDKDIRLQGNDGGSTITALTLDMSDAGKATFNSDIVVNAKVQGASGQSLTVEAQSGGAFIINTNGANERVRVNSAGRITTFACTNSNGSLNLVGEGGLSGRAVSFQHTTNGSEVGYIGTTSSSTIYNTASDARLKENVSYEFDATTRLKQLKPCRFNFIIDADTTVDCFLAHEVQTIVPEAISGTHNEVEVWKDSEELPDGVSVGDNKLDEDGNTIPVYQGIDQSKLVPLLVKTIQELEARITALENAE